MGISRKFRRRKQKKEFKVTKQAFLEEMAWVDDDGLHIICEENDPAEHLYKQLTVNFKNDIMESEIWEQVVKEHGEKKALDALAEMDINSDNFDDFLQTIYPNKEYLRSS